MKCDSSRSLNSGFCNEQNNIERKPEAYNLQHFSFTGDSVKRTPIIYKHLLHCNVNNLFILYIEKFPELEKKIIFLQIVSVFQIAKIEMLTFLLQFSR